MSSVKTQAANSVLCMLCIHRLEVKIIWVYTCHSALEVREHLPRFLFIVCVLGVYFRISGLVASAITHQVSHRLNSFCSFYKKSFLAQADLKNWVYS